MSLLAAPAKTCNRCDQRIEWATHVTTLRSVPCNPEPDPHGQWIVSDGRCASAEPGKRYPDRIDAMRRSDHRPTCAGGPDFRTIMGVLSDDARGVAVDPTREAIRARNIARDQERDAHPWRG